MASSRLSSLFPLSHGGSAPSRSMGNRAYQNHANPLLLSPLRFFCSSRQFNSNGIAHSPPSICDRFFIPSTLASSLLCHPMQTPQGNSLMAMASQSLPPSLISQVASQQLELLAAASSSSNACVQAYKDSLHRHIEEVKERESNKAVQEIIYALVASRLLYSMLPGSQDLISHPDSLLSISMLQDPAMVEQPQPCHGVDDRLQALQPPEVRPLTAKHVAMVVYGKGYARARREPDACAQVDRFKMGRMYAASVMHGYFLARVYQRFRLDQTLGLDSFSMRIGMQADPKTPLLEDYIKGDAFQNAGTLREMCSINSFDTLEVIEHHCAALFGEFPYSRQRAAVMYDDVNASVSINLRLVTSLLYQALAFGLLLWDVEHNFTPLYLHICKEH